ncbi:MFS transporter [Lonepinella koalarum]|uniref:MFS transporter n=1 Tax=Lonepinella koalarum TaxID=53417 RepID=UPI003F6DAB7B
MTETMTETMTATTPTQAPLRKQDWALLFTTATFKFVVVSFYLISLITILKDQQVDLELISWVYLLASFETISALLTPILERFYFPRFGKFKSWLALSIHLLFACFVALYFINPVQDFAVLLLICGVLSLMSVLFGCAALGLTCVLLPSKERGYGGMFHIVGARLGRMLGGGLMLWVYQHYGWHTTTLIMGLLSFALCLQILAYRESPHSLQTNQYSLGFFFKRLISFWQAPNTGWIWLIILFISCVPYSLLASTFIPKLNTLGWQPQQIGFLLAVISPIASIIAAPLSIPLLKKYSRNILVQSILFIQIAVISIFLVGEYLHFPSIAIACFIVLLGMSYSVLLPVLLAILMDKAQFPTLDSSLQFSVITFGGYIGGFVALRLINLIDYQGIYWVAVGFAGLVWWLAYRKYIAN